MKLLRKVGAIFDPSITGLAVAAGLILVFLWGLICIEVIVRFLFDYSILWTVEVGQLGLGLIAFLGAAWVLKKEGHIKIDILTSRLRPRGRAVFGVITSIMGIVICLFLIWYGTKVTIDHFQRGLVDYECIVKMATWPRFAVISLGCLLLLVQFCRRAYGHLMVWRRLEIEEVAPREEKIEF